MRYAFMINICQSIKLHSHALLTDMCLIGQINVQNFACVMNEGMLFVRHEQLMKLFWWR